MTRLNDKDVFVIGDVHGHLDRLEALLLKAGCNEKDCYVVQLGDLGHFGGRHGSPTGDLLCWQMFRDGGLDYVLWGNHDRAVVDPRHHFGGYEAPKGPEIKHIMKLMAAEGRLLLAIEAHGWLLTHAGLHAQFKYNTVPFDKTDVGAIADWINLHPVDEDPEDRTLTAVVNAIGGKRGGWSPYGGILWRDISEKLFGVPQVFGHSASYKRKIRGQAKDWWCIDIGGKGGREDPKGNCLAGIWLPSQEVVRVDLEEVPNQVLQSTGSEPSADSST